MTDTKKYKISSIGAALQENTKEMVEITGDEKSPYGVGDDIELTDAQKESLNSLGVQFEGDEGAPPATPEAPETPEHDNTKFP